MVIEVESCAKHNLICRYASYIQLRFNVISYRRLTLQHLPSNRSLSSRRASLLSRRSCLSISWLMRFCSLASSDRQHAIAATTVAAPCGPVHHDDGGRWAAAVRPLLPAVLPTRRSHHHHHQRGQQQQTSRATPQWLQRRASLKTHSVVWPRPPPPQ